MELIHQFNDGEVIGRTEDTLFIKFPRTRNIAGNSPLNGGLQTGIEAIFNNTPPRADSAQELPGGSIEKYLRLIAKTVGLKPETSSGLITAAKMKNAACKTSQFRELVVKAIVTAGIDINGCRAGDPASYYEEGGGFHALVGTINILITINANMPPETLLKCIITATEAKAAALQELMAPSRYSSGLATGSGTDGIIVAADPSSPLSLSDAGSHSKLGELIGRTVKDGVKSALAMQTGLSAERQLNILERLKRFNVDRQYFWNRASRMTQLKDPGEYNQGLISLNQNPGLVALAAAIIHLQDEAAWGLLPEDQVIKAVRAMVSAEHADALRCSDKDDMDMPLINFLVDFINNIIADKIMDNQ